MTPTDGGWTREEKVELAKRIAMLDLSPERSAELFRKAVASGPPPRMDPALLAMAEALGRAAARQWDEIVAGVDCPDCLKVAQDVAAKSDGRGGFGLCWRHAAEGRQAVEVK